MNITSDCSSIIAILLVERNKTILASREGGPHNRPSLSISFFLSFYSGSVINADAMKARAA